MRIVSHRRRPGRPVLRDPDEASAFPRREITVYERNRADDTFGWGVVFSRRDARQLRARRPRELRRDHGAASPTGATSRPTTRDTCVRSTGHGFCGLSRKRLLADPPRALPRARRAARVRARGRRRRASSPRRDLVLGRRRHQQPVRAALRRALPARRSTGASAASCWLGTTSRSRPSRSSSARASTACSRCTPTRSSARSARTFIVECHEETWQRAGLDRADEAETVRLLRGALRRAPRRPPAAHQPLDLAQLPDRHATSAGTTATSCCSATPRTRRTSRSARAPSSPWRTRSRSRDAFREHGTGDGRRARGAGGLRGGAPRRGRQAAEGGADEPRVVREPRALPAASTRCSSPST